MNDRADRHEFSIWESRLDQLIQDAIKQNIDPADCLFALKSQVLTIEHAFYALLLNQQKEQE